ncbi:hypothetical protein TGPRC2_256035 [Toxoplasma gondii TgCatPRC2]|uniref:Transmembrane protein n=15 Tax=Toxoplasma gondii TaxID=5811 RepID=A0A125YVN3_TOXGV|nr:hypothetical protein TGME49_256035 [Toxoplasma gondii ME49]EPR63094.1 hypothetical protein TGGT1_256035 [Toxoplasma gondii GT1]ESS35451.1 hypothetical protein TGVEG_256035 [Toxoplasma gondii VEG]KAF4641498.1 hypothetical protein TGRH88_073080 [Toxoplasma gondii]KFG31181.1 hypothetical protein TGDOM2_256035 [Toxoplasma gondii GAB2-2007-GAL-DOM2]KFG37117.1 hypothetical protein TGFOU_256035 [Toxoplasma gondii FOU]KFG50497.1 hypothetical protein TGP89_256035 [Toxoplasma gondii p89]KFG57613.1 |eukprot:XP_018636948.1 hypothetical protein TGME49_256035 [Toxoplasma gondii ME49]
MSLPKTMMASATLTWVCLCATVAAGSRSKDMLPALLGDLQVPPHPVLNIHIEESADDHLDSLRFGKEKRSLRRSLADLWAFEKDDVKALQEVATGENEALNQLTQIAAMNEAALGSRRTF